jgi:polyhydroxyalkanoate synthesis regulator protein
MAMIEQAMKLWAPFSPQPGVVPSAPATEAQTQAIEDLKRQLEVLQRQLNSLNEKQK